MNQVCFKIRNWVYRNLCASPLKHIPLQIFAHKLFIRVVLNLYCVSAIWSSQICFAGNNHPDHDTSLLSVVANPASPSVKGANRHTQEIFDGMIESVNASNHKGSTSGRINEKDAAMNQFWGKIVDSPSGRSARYYEKDLVYIRCLDSKRGLIREGDRFTIFSDSSSTTIPTTTNKSSDLGNVALGQIEITSSGSDLITGIILECRSFIRNGSQVSPLSETTIEPSCIPTDEIISSMDGRKS